MQAKVILIIAIILNFTSPIAARAQGEIPTSQQQIKLSFAPIVKKVAPAVVNIYTKRKVNVRYTNPFFSDPFFSRFMGQDMFGGHMRQRVENSLGSGVIVSSDGLIVTNVHVIKNADQITISLNDGHEYEATLKLQDEASDLALLQINDLKKKLPFVKLHPSESLEVGDLVIAIGNPFGVGQSVTSGIVSAQGRSALNVNDYNFFIQTDAAINPGNSGGALVDLDGGVVGINTAIYSRDGGSLGIGFAIPSEMVNTIIIAANQGQTGTSGIARPWLGFEAQNITNDIANSLNLETPAGILVSSLHPLSPLKKAGLQTGDVIIKMNDKPIKDAAEMRFRTATIGLEKTAALTIIHQGEHKNITFTATRPPDSPARDLRIISGNNPFSGTTLANLNPAVAFELGLSQTKDHKDVVIFETKPQSPITRTAKVGDTIIEINGQKITSAKQAEKIIKHHSANQGWDIILSSKGRTQRIMLR